jgi:hypothetical protein
MDPTFIDTNPNSRPPQTDANNTQGLYLRLSRIAENHAFDRQTRYEASLTLLEKAINDDNLE